MKSRATTPVKSYALIDHYDCVIKSPFSEVEVYDYLEYVTENAIDLSNIIIIELPTGKMFNVEMKTTYKFIPQKNRND